MYEIIMLVFKCINHYEHLCTDLAQCLKYCTIIQSDCKIKINKKFVVFLLNEHNILIRDVTIKNINI